MWRGLCAGQTLSLKRKEFVEAAEVGGVSNTAIVFRHIVPNVLGVAGGVCLAFGAGHYFV